MPESKTTARPTAGWRVHWIALGILWLASVTTGMAVLADHQAAPAAAATAPAHWPDASAIERADGLPTLVMLAHPLCPCTRASVAELERLMARAAGRVAAHVVFLAPEEAEDGSWQSAGLRETASAIPGVAVHADTGGREAQAFGAFTSGQTLLYDAAGRLVFAGGITDGRGHEGDNVGRDAVVARLLDGETESATVPVFGCLLRDPHASAPPRSEPS